MQKQTTSALIPELTTTALETKCQSHQLQKPKDMKVEIWSGKTTEILLWPLIEISGQSTRQKFVP